MGYSRIEMIPSKKSTIKRDSRVIECQHGPKAIRLIVVPYGVSTHDDDYMPYNLGQCGAQKLIARRVQCVVPFIDSIVGS